MSRAMALKVLGTLGISCAENDESTVAGSEPTPVKSEQIITVPLTFVDAGLELVDGSASYSFNTTANTIRGAMGIRREKVGETWQVINGHNQTLTSRYIAMGDLQITPKNADSPPVNRLPVYADIGWVCGNLQLLYFALPATSAGLQGHEGGANNACFFISYPDEFQTVWSVSPTECSNISVNRAEVDRGSMNLLCESYSKNALSALLEKP